jgi:hypothetical protein
MKDGVTIEHSKIAAVAFEKAGVDILFLVDSVVIVFKT